jgi:ABC-2 type transport system ATP-binding protein
MGILKLQMLTLNAVNKFYARTHAVKDVSFSIDRPGVVGLLGPNGAGKSTIMKMVACLLAPTSGTLAVCNHDTLSQSSLVRAKLGYLAEFAPLYSEMTPLEYLHYRTGLFGISSSKAKLAVSRAVERCWLTDMKNRPISALSKGYRQRVGLAAAIVHDPSVIILDEPSTGLDPEQILQMRSLLKELGQTSLVLLSSHILPEVEKTCERLLIIARGTLCADGTPSQLLNQAHQSMPLRIELLNSTTDLLERAKQTLALVAGIENITIRSETAKPSIEIRLNPSALANPSSFAATINQALFGAGIIASEVHRPQATLEQVFIQAVEGKQTLKTTSASTEAAA